METYLMIKPGRDVVSYKYTAGPSAKEYDLWVTLIGAMEFYRRGAKTVDAALDDMYRCSPGVAWAAYVRSKYKMPWGLVNNNETQRWSEI